MNKIFFIANIGQKYFQGFMEGTFVPRIGDKTGVFYDELGLLRVTEVITYPSVSMLKNYGIKEGGWAAIVLCSI